MRASTAALSGHLPRLGVQKRGRQQCRHLLPLRDGLAGQCETKQLAVGRNESGAHISLRRVDPPCSLATERGRGDHGGQRGRLHQNWHGWIDDGCGRATQRLCESPRGVRDWKDVAD